MYVDDFGNLKSIDFYVLVHAAFFIHRNKLVCIVDIVLIH